MDDPRDVMASYIERQRLSDQPYHHADRIEQLLEQAGWTLEEKESIATARELCERLKADIPSLPGDVLALRTSYLLDAVIDVLGGPSEVQPSAAPDGGQS